MTTISCDQQRKDYMENENVKLHEEIIKMSKLTEETVKIICFNPYTKKHEWKRSANLTQVCSWSLNAAKKRQKKPHSISMVAVLV